MYELILEDRIIVNRPLEEVFNYMDDIENEHEWQPYPRKWEQSPDPHQTGVGTIRRYDNRYMGRSFSNEYEVVVYEPMEKVMYMSTPQAAVQAEGATLWEPANGGTKVTFLFKPQMGDFWGFVPKAIAQRIYMGTLSNNMRRLKDVLEGCSLNKVKFAF
jgi:uncharacterized membrane protein